MREHAIEKRGKLKRHDFLRQTILAYVLANRNLEIIMGDYKPMEDLGEHRGKASKPRESAVTGQKGSGDSDNVS